MTGQCHAFTAARWRFELQKHRSIFTDPVVGVGLCHVHQFFVVYKCTRHLSEYLMDIMGDKSM